MIFKRSAYVVTLNRVRDAVCFREGAEELTLTVDADAMRMVSALNDAQKVMRTVGANSTPDEQRKAAMLFAESMFGRDQAEKLMTFYHDDAANVINVCGMYFTRRLGKKITAAQKKRR